MLSNIIQEQRGTLILIKNIGCSLSIITSAIVVFLYWLFRENRSFAMTNIILLSIINAIFCLSMVVPVENNESSLCIAQSFLINTFQQGQFICSCVIGYCCFMTVIKKNHLEKNKMLYQIIFYIIDFGLPIALSLIILLTKSYGDSGGFCWLDFDNKHKRYFIDKLALILFATLWFLLTINLFMIVKVMVIIRKTKIQNKIYRHINWYPVVIMISAIPATVNRLYGIYNKKHNNFILAIIQMISETFCGFVINILFLSSPWTRESIIHIFQAMRMNEENPNERLIDTSLKNDNESSASSKIQSLRSGSMMHI